MSVTKTAKHRSPQTLMRAHEELVAARPCRKASLSVWLEYYRYSVTVYERVAQTDPGHECEALYWAQRERDHAHEIEARMRAQIPGG